MLIFDTQISNSAEDAKRNYVSQINFLIKDFLAKIKQTGVVIWGKGEISKQFTELFVENNCENSILAYCDSFTKDKSTFLLDKPLLSPADAAMEYPDATFIIASMYHSDILEFISVNNLKDKIKNLFVAIDAFNDFNLLYSWLMCFKHRDINDRDYSKTLNLWAFFDYYNESAKQGLLEKKLEKLFSLLEDDISKEVIKNRVLFFLTGDISFLKKIPFESYSKIYFNPFFSFSEHESYFDCGSFDGDTIKAFIKCCNNKFEHITAFEPEPKYFEITSSLVNSNEVLKNKTLVVNAGVGNNQIYSSDNNGMFKVVSLDDYEQYKPSLIKMDIEGFEMDALKGADKIISKYHPKLAVCVYHLPQDIFDIPELLTKYSPKYKFVIRHHLGLMYDTVLYAK